ncbi:FAD-dependent oxidoreductase [Herbiconiux sp. P18]|uniref:FAD-dependent oxidoreductase n=1 Tax=Herbiconiux liangxiaofengii TaxID=3342795 RepID=UPI003CF10E1F
MAYADPVHLRMLADADRLWQELEAETDRSLLTRTGIVSHGHNPAYTDMARMLPNRGFDAELIAPAEAERRWPGIRFDGQVLVAPQGGRIDADGAVAALQQAAVARGARVRHRARVTRIRVLGDDRAAVEVTPTDAADEPSGDPELFECRRLVVTLGAWTSRLLGSVLVLPKLTVTREEPAHFRPLDDTAAWPGFNHLPAPDPRYGYWPAPVYGLLTPGEGVKVGWHGAGAVTDPDAPTARTDRRRFAALQHYAREWLPGVDPTEYAEISCTYTSTRDSAFVIDRVGPVAVGAGFSGHGFKFVPVVGGLLADLTEGVRAPAVFSLRADRRRPQPVR